MTETVVFSTDCGLCFIFLILVVQQIEYRGYFCKDFIILYLHYSLFWFLVFAFELLLHGSKDLQWFIMETFSFRLVAYIWVQDQKSWVIICEGLHEVKWQPQSVSREQVLYPKAATKVVNKEAVKYV